MDDRALLEAAARAAGIGPVLCYETRRNCLRIGHRDSYSLWRPLTDDGDALRLITRLRMAADASGGVNEVRYWIGTEECPRAVLGEDDTDSDMRRCIVRAAAAIGA